MNEIRRGIRPRRIGVAALLVAGMAMTAHAQAPDSDRIERQRIAAQRGQANAAFAQAERECRQRFAVTACMDEARGRQREALASLRRQGALLDEAERRQRAAARAQSIRGKLSAEEARQQGAGRTRREVAPRSAPERPEAEPRAIPPRSPTQAASAASAQREATEARNRARHEARQAQVQSHREAAERRAAQRLQRAMPAAPLPPASAPRR